MKHISILVPKELTKGQHRRPHKYLPEVNKVLKKAAEASNCLKKKRPGGLAKGGTDYLVIIYTVATDVLAKAALKPT